MLGEGEGGRGGGGGDMLQESVQQPETVCTIRTGRKTSHHIS